MPKDSKLKVVSAVSTRGILYLPEKGVLMIKKSKKSASPGFWEFPGGKFEQIDLYLRTTLALEFLEKTGIPVSTINAPVYVWDEPSKISNNNNDSHYICIIY